MTTKTRWIGWLEADQLKRLKAVAAQEKSSIAWVVRRALDAYLLTAKGPKR